MLMVLYQGLSHDSHIGDGKLQGLDTLLLRHKPCTMEWTIREADFNADGAVSGAAGQVSCR